MLAAEKGCFAERAGTTHFGRFRPSLVPCGVRPGRNLQGAPRRRRRLWCDQHGKIALAQAPSDVAIKALLTRCSIARCAASPKASAPHLQILVTRLAYLACGSASVPNPVARPRSDAYKKSRDKTTPLLVVRLPHPPSQWTPPATDSSVPPSPARPRKSARPRKAPAAYRRWRARPSSPPSRAQPRNSPSRVCPCRRRRPRRRPTTSARYNPRPSRPSALVPPPRRKSVGRPAWNTSRTATVLAERRRRR